MSQPVRNKGPVRGARAPEPARKAVIFPVIVVAVLLVGGLAGFWVLDKSLGPSPPAQLPAPPPESTPPASVSRGAASPAPVPTPVTPAPPTPAPPPIRVPAPAPPVAVIPTPVPPASPQDLVSSLAQLDLKNSATADQARGALQQLIRQGAAAVPVITNYLAQNQETNFAGAGGADPWGYPSLRAGLLDALAQIGGPDANAAILQVLQTSTYPGDVAQLFKSLGPAATAEYQQDFLGAVRQQLTVATLAPPGNSPDVGPLFQVLSAEGAGGAQVAQDIQQYGSNWPFYSAIALAGLPNGAGLSALADMAQTSGSGQTVAVDSLAQLAPGNPQALAALLDLAKSGQLSDYTLESVAPFLAGQQFMLSPQSDRIPPGAQIQTIHMSGGNQNFTCVLGSAPAEIPRQIGVIDQLLQVVPPSDTGTVQALQQQKNTLSTRLGR